MDRSLVHYLPIATTLVAIPFAWTILRRWHERGGPHLLCWGIGVALYGLGTLTESLTTLNGWSEPVFRAWYVSGALLGGAPLAQGTVYLLLRRRTADLLTVVVGTVITVAALAVVLSPIDYSLVEHHRLTGRVLEWRWARLFSPFINLYAATFLIGGAVYSALRYRRVSEMRHRYLGNIAIAVGALLPGIGGTFTRFGMTEVLYVTELAGLSLIYLGYRLSVSVPAPPASP
ncbi:MAG TPA: hypothetical protein VFN96_08260 [Gemmatimonadales bacterium]|nr:hypothetical protein [Gemmatimonadales bacterium]